MQLSWESTLPELFPELTMDRHWAGVTLEQLLLHQGGAPHTPPDDLWKEALERKGTPTEQRLKFVKGVLALPP